MEIWRTGAVIIKVYVGGKPCLTTVSFFCGLPDQMTKGYRRSSGMVKVI